jgi:hypothetical protein
LVLCSGEHSILSYYWHPQEAEVSTGFGSTKRRERKKGWMKPSDLQGVMSATSIGWLLLSSSVTSIKDVTNDLTPLLQVIFKNDYPTSGDFKFSLVNRPVHDIPATAVGNTRWPLKDNTPVSIIVETQYARWASTKVYRLLNKSEYNKYGIPYRFTPFNEYSPSTKPDAYYSQMTQKHKGILANMVVVYDSTIKDLTAVHKDLTTGLSWTLKSYIQTFYFPLLPPRDDHGNPLDSDGNGNIKYDEKGNPIPAAKLVHEATFAHFKRDTQEFAFTCQKQHAPYLRRVLAMLPKLCDFMLHGTHKNWFQEGHAKRIIKDVKLTLDPDGDWTG